MRSSCGAVGHATLPAPPKLCGSRTNPPPGGVIIGIKEKSMQNDSARPLASGLTVLGALARVLPHLPNFSPVGSISLFAGARMRGWQAYALPLVLMAVTDPLVGGYSAATPLIYASFLINVWIGSRLRRTESPLKIGAGVIAGSLQFFLLTNFA